MSARSRGHARPRAPSPESIVAEIVARAVVARDPSAVIRRARLDTTLPPEVRRALDAASEDGLQMTALLVAKLRFERLIQGSVDAGAAYESDPRGFTAAFRRYHEEVPPAALFPPQEAALFVDWLKRRRDPGD